jgi:hypothetical protein
MWELVAAVMKCGGPKRGPEDVSYWGKLDRAVMAAFPGIDCRTWRDPLNGDRYTSKWFKEGTMADVSRYQGMQIRAFIRGFNAGAYAADRGIE